MAERNFSLNSENEYPFDGLPKKSDSQLSDGNSLKAFPWKTAVIAFLSGILLSIGSASVAQKLGFAPKPAFKPNLVGINSIAQHTPPQRTSRRIKNDDDDDDDDAIQFDCDDGKYEKRTLKLAYERPMAALFSAYEKKFETSSVIVVDQEAYAICDSSFSIYKFGLDLQPRGSSHIRFGDPLREGEDEDSDYEAIFYYEGVFYVVRESIEHEDGTYHSIIEEVVLDSKTTVEKDRYSLQRQCSTEFEFEGDSKGFEGLWGVRDSLTNELFLLGLCEGNHCSEEYKNDRGNGRIVVMRQSTLETGECLWKTVKEIDIPKSAYFADYSAMSVDDNGYIAITSQEDSQLWVGRLLGKQENTGLWDINGLTFDQVGEVFDFPKDNDCKTIFCNIEGIHWLGDGTLLAASDKMKKKGKQHYRCREHDQSIHVFVLP